MVNLGQAVGYLDLDTSGFSRGFKSALGDLKVLNDQTATAADKFKGVGSAMTTVGSSLTRNVTVPLLGAAAATVKFASDFDDGLKKVSTIADTNVKSIDQLGKEVLALSSDVNISTSDLNEALYQTLSATGDTANAMSYLEVASKLAKGGFTDVTTAVDGATSVMNAYGLTGEEAFAKIADTMITTQNVGKTTVDELAKSLFQVIPTAASLGVSFEEVSAGLAAITAQGTPTNVATTQMRQLFVELSKDGGKAAKTFQKMSGKTFKDFISSGGSVAEALALMDEAAKKDGKSLSDMFGSVEAGNAALQLTGVGGEKFADALDAMGNSAGSTDEAFKKMSESAGDQFSRVINNLKNIAIQFGTIILPYVLKLTEGIGNFMKKLLDMDEGTKKTIVTILGIVAALGPILLIGGKIVSGIGSVMSLVSSLSGVLAALGTTIGAIALPVLAVVAAIVALWIAWQTNFGGIREYTAQIFADLKEIFTTVMAFIKSAWESDLGGIRTYVMAVLEFIKLLFQQVMDAISTTIRVILKIIKGDWQGAWDEIKGFFERTWQRIQEYVSLVIDTIKTLISKWLDIIKSVWESVWSGIQQFFENIWNGIKVFFSGVLEWIKTTIDNALNTVKSLWENIWNSIKTFFENLWTTIKTLLSSYLTWVVDTIKNIGSSLYNAAQTAFNFIKTAFETVWNTITGWFSTAIQTIVSTVTGIGTSLYNAGRSIFESLWNGLKSMWDSISNWFSGVIDKISGWLSGIWDSITGAKNAASDAKSMAADGSHASGLDYVPYNGYIAQLHEGERVLTAEEARGQDKSNGDVFNFYSPVALTPVESAREMKKAKQELALGFM